MKSRPTRRISRKSAYQREAEAAFPTMDTETCPDFEWGSDDDWEEQMIMECQMLPDGQCLLAGSEHCEFDCPFRD